MVTQSVSGSTIKHHNRPYQPSWFDRLLNWIEELPGPAWVVYLAALIGSAIIINAAFWIDGTLPFWTFDPLNTTFSVFIVYWPLLYRYLTRMGSRALLTFRPLLDVPDEEIDRIEYQITTLPSFVGWVAVPLGYGLAALTILTDPAPYGDLVPNTILPYTGDILLTGFMISTFFCLLIRSIRQLRMVSKLHSRATNINLLELKPAHAFSDLTARTGIGLILVIIASYPANPPTYSTPLDILLTIITALIAIGIFILPVMGIQARLEEEKERTLSQTHQQLQAVRDRLHSQVRSGDFGNMGSIKDAIEALIDERNLINAVSTWPWNPKTIRGFASALLLPVFLGFVTQLLDRIL